MAPLFGGQRSPSPVPHIPVYPTFPCAPFFSARCICAFCLVRGDIAVCCPGSDVRLPSPELSAVSHTHKHPPHTHLEDRLHPVQCPIREPAQSRCAPARREYMLSSSLSAPPSVLLPQVPGAFPSCLSGGRHSAIRTGPRFSFHVALTPSLDVLTWNWGHQFLSWVSVMTNHEKAMLQSVHYRKHFARV